jgi:ectoine hydrolase
MAEAELDLLWITDPSNMGWLTGYDGWSFYVHQGVLVGHEGEPVFWGRGMDAVGALRTAWMAAENCVGYADDYVQNPAKHPMEDAARLIRERAPPARRIGVELDNYYYSAKAHAVLTAALPEALRRRDRPRQLAAHGEEPAGDRLYPAAADIVGRMHAAIRETIRPGLRKNELVAEIVRAGIVGTEEAGGDYPAIVPLLPTGSGCGGRAPDLGRPPLRGGRRHLLRDRRLPPPLPRAALPDRLPRRAAAGDARGRDGAPRGARGRHRRRPRRCNVAGDVARALARFALARAGIEKTGRCGYPIGLSYPPDWGERTISFRDSDTSVLEPGMTFHFMPGLWFDDWGLEITETILIRETGPAECLASVPRARAGRPVKPPSGARNLESRRGGAGGRNPPPRAQGASAAPSAASRRRPPAEAAP